MGNPTSRRHRRLLARSIQSVVDDAEEPARGLSSQFPLACGEVREERELLLDLAGELSGPDDVNPHGVVLVEGLLTDGASPIYRGGREGTLHERLVLARDALDLT